MEKRKGRMPKLSKDIPWFFQFNPSFSDRPTFIGFARHDNSEEKTVMTGIIFDKPLGRFHLPRVIRDETSDWGLKLGESEE